MKDQLILIYSYLYGIWRYRWSALIISCVVALTGWVTVYAMPDHYSAQAIIHVDTKSVMQPLLKGLAVESEIDAGLALMSRVLLSRKNLEEVIRRTDMDLKANDQASMDALVVGLAKSIVLRTDGKRKKNNNNNVYVLSYEGESPKLVYQIVSKLLNTLIENTLDTARTDTASAQKFLDRQIVEHENRLSTAEQKLASFKRANVGFMPDERGGYYNRLQRLQGEIGTISSQLKLTKRKHSQMLRQLAGEASIIDNNSYTTAKALKLRKYREELDILLTQYREKHPDVVALRQTIAEVMADDNVNEVVNIGSNDTAEFNPVYQELKAEINKTSIEVEVLKVTLAEKKNSMEALKKAVDILPEVEAKLAKLNRDYEITRERYLSLVSRRESARLSQEVGQSGNNVNFRIIDPPRLPTHPSGPNRNLLLTIVFFAALAVGLAWGFLRYLIHPTYIASNQIRDRIGLPILGSVGLYLTEEHKKKRRAQLTSFLLGFFLLVISYGGFMVFSKVGSDLLNTLISTRNLVM